jgi:hypothetical protein
MTIAEESPGFDLRADRGKVTMGASIPPARVGLQLGVDPGRPLRLS